VSENRFKDTVWQVNKGLDGMISFPGAQLTVLMDIRDELKKLNALLHCSNFTAIPHVMREVARNTKPKKRKRKKTA